MNVLYISISDFGSIAGVNRWKSREDTLLKCWCQNNKRQSEELFKALGYTVEKKPIISEETTKLKEEFCDVVRTKKPKCSEETEVIIKTFTEKIDSIPTLTKKERVCMKESMKSTLNTSCGVNNETEILDKVEKKSGKVVEERNSRMYYKTIYVSPDGKYEYKIGGKVDGLSEDSVIEAKYRMRESNVRKNEYDLYQLMGYIYLTGLNKGKLVQKYGGRVWDSDTETDKEWGVVTLDDRWKNFYETKLMTFFESLKNVPVVPRTLCKPFLTIYNDKYYPSTEIRDTEKSILRIVYNVFV